MSMSDLEQAFQLIDQNEESADFSGPKPEELVRSAEAALGLALPPTYREFVKRLGCGGVTGEEFYGIIDGNFENSSVPDGIWVTLDERKKSNLPESLVIVGDNGRGGWYAIDTSTKNADGDSPIIEWWHKGVPTQVLATDFGAFLLESLRAVLNGGMDEEGENEHERE
jgi:antitoxin YobK